MLMSPKLLPDTARSAKVEMLFQNLHDVLGDKFTHARFDQWKKQYERESRLFHGLDHLLAMTERDPSLSEKSKNEKEIHSAAAYSIVAGFFHDTDYPSISE